MAGDKSPAMTSSASLWVALATKQFILLCRQMDCFASLAMTAGIAQAVDDPELEIFQRVPALWLLFNLTSSHFSSSPGLLDERHRRSLLDVPAQQAGIPIG